LEDATGVFERFEIQREAQAVGASANPLLEVTDIGCRELGVSLFSGELNDGGRAKAAIEVVMQQNLGTRMPWSILTLCAVKDQGISGDT
jgi:hypothetical protein